MLDYDIVDVFTSRPFAGNALAVVHGAEQLTDAQLAALAAEFNLSETAFPMASRTGAGDYLVRIFTPGGEVPFAGHPSIGTAWVLRRAGRVGTGHVVQECGIGSVDLQLPEDDGPVQLSAEPRDRGAPVDAEVVEAVAAAVGLGGADVDGLVVVAGCGLSFVYLPVRAAALARARAAVTDLGPLRVGQLAADPVGGIDVFAVAGTGDRLTVRSRVFCPEVSVPEDPATGSAALGLGIALVGTGRLPAGGGRYHISQGVQMGRPSQLFARVEAAGGVVTRCHVAGGVAAVASGRIRVPPRTD